MRDFLNQTVKNLKPSGIRKFFDMASTIKDVISLGVGEPDFDTPWSIREEAIYSLEKGKTFYTSNSGLIELRSAISTYIYEKYNLKYDKSSEILVTVGGSEAIDVALRAMIEPGDEVIIPTPSYVSYEPCSILAGAVVKNVPLKSENKFMITKEELENVISNKSKILILNYPNNPTGGIMDKKHLEDIRDIVIKYDLFVISDEIYSELIYDNEHVSIASLPNMKERCLVINGLSKAFSMTGWRLGYACGPENIIKQMTKIHQFGIMCAPTISQFAAIEALKNCDEEVKKMREAYMQRRNYLVNRLNDMGLECHLPYGAFYVFPSIKKFNLSSEEFALKLLEAEKVVVVPGTAFGDAGEGFIRISYAYSIEDLKKALDRLQRFIENNF